MSYLTPVRSRGGRRLAWYTGGTSPAFLGAVASKIAPVTAASRASTAAASRAVALRRRLAFLGQDDSDYYGDVEGTVPAGSQGSAYGSSAYQPGFVGPLPPGGYTDYSLPAVQSPFSSVSTAGSSATSVLGISSSTLLWMGGAALLGLLLLPELIAGRR